MTNILSKQLTEAACNKIISSIDLSYELLRADAHTQKKIETLFQKSYYKVILDEIPKNKALWKSPSHINSGNFFIILQYIDRYDRLKFIQNIGHENVYCLQSAWKIKKVAKLLPHEDEKIFLHTDYLKHKYTLKDLLGFFDALGQPIHEQWKLVQDCLGKDRAKEILTILDNNQLPNANANSLLAKESAQEPVALQVLKCNSTEALASLLKNKTALQQRWIVELFGGGKEIKHLLAQENNRKDPNSEHPSNRYISFSELMKSFPVDTQIELIGLPDPEDLNKNEPNVLKRNKTPKPIIGQFNNFLEYSEKSAIVNLENHLMPRKIKAKL